jgi:hypothetical protein
MLATTAPTDPRTEDTKDAEDPRVLAAAVAVMSPVGIDTVLADLWEAESAALTARVHAYDGIHVAAGDKQTYLSRSTRVWKLAYADAVAVVEQRAADGDQRAGKALTCLADAQARLEALHGQAAPYTAEFRRRGGWGRAFLAQSSDGHVHSSQHCSTLHRGPERTPLVWMLDYSGKSEPEIVAAAGWRACTVCYPSAPVGDEKTLPTRMFSKADIDRAQARQERDAARAARLAAKAAKAITSPDGSPLQVFNRHVPERQRTLRNGTVDTVAAHDVFDTIETLAAAKSWLTNSQESWRGAARTQDAQNLQRVAEAIAHKLGTTAQEEIAAAKKRAARRG